MYYISYFYAKISQNMNFSAKNRRLVSSNPREIDIFGDKTVTWIYRRTLHSTVSSKQLRKPTRDWLGALEKAVNEQVPDGITLKIPAKPKKAEFFAYPDPRIMSYWVIWFSYLNIYIKLY